MLKRIFDFVFSVCVLTIFALPVLLVAFSVRVTSSGPIIYWSKRVGRHGRIFAMPKFRTMREDAPAVATHLLSNPDIYITPVGRFLRKTSLDELPQFWSILVGDMSVVGPRPALFNQSDLITLRIDAGVDELLPGLTGLAQINGRDELPISEKVKLDAEYLSRRSFWFDLKVVVLTVVKVIRRKDVVH